MKETPPRRIWNCGSQTYHWCIHQDTEVITQIGTSYAQGVHAGENEEVAKEEEWNAGIFDEGLEEKWVRGLVRQALIVDIVPDDAQREDGHG
jgi:hypothetical protein